LRQFRHSRLNNRFASPLAALSNGGEQVIGFNKFNVDYSAFAWQENRPERSQRRSIELHDMPQRRISSEQIRTARPIPVYEHE
jgi:hypothetical protein